MSPSKVELTKTECKGAVTRGRGWENVMLLTN